MIISYIMSFSVVKLRSPLVGMWTDTIMGFGLMSSLMRYRGVNGTHKVNVWIGFIRSMVYGPFMFAEETIMCTLKCWSNACSHNWEVMRLWISLFYSRMEYYPFQPDCSGPSQFCLSVANGLVEARQECGLHGNQI